MKIMKTQCIPITFFLRLFLLVAFLIFPLGPVNAVHASDIEAGTLTHVSISLISQPAAAQPVISTLAPGALPRSETLYFNGQQWGSVTCWNPYSSGCNNMMAIAQQDNARVTMFETPYIYNMIDGQQYPLLADGPYTWNGAHTEITFKIKPAAHWSDGTPVTAFDVAYTWLAHIAYGTDIGNGFQEYIDGIDALDPQTVLVRAKLDVGGNAINPLLVSSYLSNSYVVQKAWTQTLEARSGGDTDAFKNDVGDDVVSSGPYMKYYADDTEVILVRDDNYWGQDASMWGRLPSPKYLAHVIYADNDSGLAAFKAGQVDVSQQYISNVQDLWLVDHLPVSTYYPDAPYHISASLPTAYYNLDAYGLDQVAVRKAIAMAVDYDMIAANAMTNQSPTFTQAPRSLMNPTPYEQALYDHDAVAALQWAGNDIAGANALLDAAGIVDTNSDGWREYNGQKLSYVATCPNGWVDWQAAVELVAAVGSQIGIEITTSYPEWSEYQTVVTNSETPFPAGYDIFMMWTDGAGPTEPWGRIRHLMSSEYIGLSNNWNGNWGKYNNPAADALIQAIPGETNPVTLKQHYTDLTEIYLTDVPSFTLMYRPQSFHTVNESIWTGFPKSGDGSNPPVPPLDLTDGYSIAGLYNLWLTSGSPTLISPVNAITLSNNRPTFDWLDMPGVANYTIQIGKNSGFTSLVGTYVVSQSSYTPVADLQANSTFFWRVKINKTGVPNPWSVVRSFTTVSPPSVPVLLLPVQNAVIAGYTPRLVWGTVTVPAGPSFDYYLVQVDDNADFSSPAIDKNIFGLANHEYTPVDALKPDTKFYWRVRAFNVAGQYSSWSAVWTFRTPLLPRTETLYFNGQQWGSVGCWNPYSSNCNNAMAISQGGSARVTMFETPYIYNLLDGKQYPLLADGDYSWNAAHTEITFTIKPSAHWSDGTPVTADDVAYTWATHIQYQTNTGNSYQGYIDTIMALNPQTVLVKAKLDGGGKAVNPLIVLGYLSDNYVIQKAWTQTLEARAGGDAGALLSDPGDDVVGSGPYKKFFADDSLVALVRDDAYWGQDAGMWSRLPAPRYLAHVIYADNDSALNAFKAGEVDVSQLFIANVQNLWLVDHLPVSTYYPDAPYGVTVSMPTAYYNLNSYGLDNIAVRKAIAMAINYDMIIANAMTDQSPTFTQVPRSLMNPTPGEQALYDQAAVASLQWAGDDIAGAKALLDAAGIVDTNNDGWRELGGQKLSYVATCPNGWSDWQAAVELVAAAGQAIGIDITTNYPEWQFDYQNAVTNWPLPTTGYDIFMMWTDGAGPTDPWGRAYRLMSSEFAQTTGNWNGNWGGYINPAADALIDAIPTETDPAILKQKYTQLTEIYLTDIPSFALMYRPQTFHTVNESVWTGFPNSTDGSNPSIPPLTMTDGYGIAGLYHLSLTSNVPTLYSPSQDAHVLNLQPAFDWQDVPGATGYTIQISTVSTFGSIARFANTVESNYTPTTDLPKGRLYWRVRSVGANGTSAWSVVRSYQGPYPPAAPTLSLPGNNMLVTDLTPLFKWAVITIPPAAPTFDKYQIQVATDLGFTSLVFQEDVVGLSNTQFTPNADFDHNRTYYWRVRGVDTLPEVGAWSPPRSFRTVLAAPILVSPPEPYDALSLRPEFFWTPPGGTGAVSGYTIQIAKDAAFKSIVHTGNPTLSSYIPTADLPKNLPLFWRVQAKGANGPSAWSDAWSFQSANSPTTPTLISPAANALVTNYLPLFKWSVVTVPTPPIFKNYELQMDDDPGFQTPITATSATNQLQIVDPNLLAHNTRYYWRVRAVNSDNEVSNWSAVRYFRTIIDPPQLLTPVDGSIDVSKLPTLDWANVDRNTGYVLQVWKAGAKPVLVKTVTLLTDVSQYTFIAALAPNTTYYWVVQTKGGNGPSFWSGKFYFTTVP